MILTRTDSKNLDFINLVKLLDAELAITDGDEHAFYNQFNKIESIKHVVLALNDTQCIGCGTFKFFDNESVEIKRMYTTSDARGKGIATAILIELENWAKELGFKNCILETGIRQPDAIALYTKNGYQLIPNYGQYTLMTNSRCFKKILV